MTIGCPSSTTDNVDCVREIVCVDKRLTTDAIASELGISHGSVHSILHNYLNVYRVCLHMVLKRFSPEQKEIRKYTSRDWTDMAAS
ncbi:uncharacterized protein TNCT_508271 [Trichonephila clavata]|uniref:Uncharacterized protein n=1 Tax=Trichonephila clavata TaxID=2740835 RepID=A0A8X6LMJ2_TRICU|nr:uncharacterized protein TNCT_508271 [Trichonephila clavata]